MMISRYLLPLCLAFVLGACHQVDTPKPRAYFRIALPEKHYQPFDSLYPYRMEYPSYASIRPDTRETAEPYWADIVFPSFSARVHLSYKPVSSQQELAEYMGDAYTFVHRHIPKATAIRESLVEKPESGVYGMVFNIRGREAASPIQFFVTDSLNHFLRGALYFNVRPNNDSLAPVIGFIEKDIYHLLGTLEWD